LQPIAAERCEKAGMKDGVDVVGVEEASAVPAAVVFDRNRFASYAI
jgi:hypothetical protein